MNGVTCRNIFLYSIVFICVSFISAITSTNSAIASDCKPKSMQTSPEKTLTIKKGKSANVTVKIKVQAEECTLDTIKTNPENKLTLITGQSSDITVRLKCKNGSPAVDVKVDAVIQKGSDSIKL